MNDNETKFEPGDTLSFTENICYADRNHAFQPVKRGEFCKVITPFTDSSGNPCTLVSYRDFAMPLSNDTLKMEEKAPAQPQNADTQKEHDEVVTRLRQQLQIAQADGIRMRDELKAEKNRNKEIRETAKGCLEAVKAMMVHSRWAGACSITQLAVDGVRRPEDCMFTITEPMRRRLLCKLRQWGQPHAFVIKRLNI